MSKGEWVFYGFLAVIGLLVISGCSAVTTAYHACRDGLCR